MGSTHNSGHVEYSVSSGAPSWKHYQFSGNLPSISLEVFSFLGNLSVSPSSLIPWLGHKELKGPVGQAASLPLPCPRPGHSSPLVLTLTEATGRSTGRQLSHIRKAPGVRSAQPASQAASKPGTMQGGSVVSAHPACLLLGQQVYESLIWWQYPEGLSQEGTCLEEAPLSEFLSYPTRGPQEPMSHELPEPRTSQC